MSKPPLSHSVVSGGDYRIDGGAIFGIVPKSLWQKSFPADDTNRIQQATNCRLITLDGQNILIDTGYGTNWPDRFRQHHDLTAGVPVVESLALLDVSPDEIQHVICSHLHFDHAGGTSVPSSSSLVTTFPKAQYHVQKVEWEQAMSEAPEFRGAYDSTRLQPIADAGQLVLHDGDDEILPGLSVHKTGGHTPGHQAIRVETGEGVYWYLGDLCATASHLAINWCMAYDLELLVTRRAKLRFLEEIARNGDFLCFDHDPNVATVVIEKRSELAYGVLSDR